MSKRFPLLLILVLLSFLALGSFLFVRFRYPADDAYGLATVHAFRTVTPPAIDGAAENAWNKAPVTTIKTKTGVPISLRFLYDDSYIYVNASYPDSTHDYIDRYWEFDGEKWFQHNQQDSLVLFWDMNDSILGFDKKGFSVMTYGLGLDQHPWDVKRGGSVKNRTSTTFLRQKADWWSTGLQLPYGKLEDWFFSYDRNETLKGGKGPVIRVQHDSFNVEGAPWVLNKTPDWRTPTMILKPGLTLESAPYATMEQMTDMPPDFKPTPGYKVPFIVYKSRDARWGGSKDDVTGTDKWKAGRWTVEARRPLNTGHADDIIFAPSTEKDYIFGLLLRRSGRQYEPTKPLILSFER